MCQENRSTHGIWTALEIEKLILEMMVWKRMEKVTAFLLGHVGHFGYSILGFN